MKSTVQKMLAYTKVRADDAAKIEDRTSRSLTAKFWCGLRVNLCKEVDAIAASQALRRMFLTTCDHSVAVAHLLTKGKFYPGEWVQVDRTISQCKDLTLPILQ
jgi:hypothetical protein